MTLDLTHGTINVPQAVILSEPDSNRVVVIWNGARVIDVLSESALPPPGTSVSLVLVPLNAPNPQPEFDMPFAVKFWDYLQ